ncbi:unnamed protein product, partial [Meganyctiphanes norvegica]
RLEANNKIKTDEVESKTSELNQLKKKLECVESDLINKREQLEGLNEKLASINSGASQPEHTSSVSSPEVNNEQLEQVQAKIKEKDSEIIGLKKTIANLEGELSNREADGQDNQSEMMSCSTISRAEDAQRMKELEDTFEERYMK